MIKVFYDLIVLKLWELERVPPRWRADVKAKLDEDGIGY